MSRRAIAAIGGAVVLVAGVGFFLLSDRDSGAGLGGGIFGGPTTCALTGEEPRKEANADRPAVAVKIENAEIAYPLAGLERADIVYEELVEGGVTRFMAIYGCGDSPKAGPVRSARMIDPAIMVPITRILAFSGGNQIVLDNLDEHEIVQIDESNARGGMQRIPREGLSTEHTLYANTGKLRRMGAKRFDDAPPETFSFGDIEGSARRARSITINFSAATTVTYDWNGERWARAQAGGPFETENHGQIGVDNVIVELHTVNLSKEITDVAGNPSVEIADETGSGRAILFRDGRAIQGRWSRDSIDDPVEFQTKSGDAMVLKAGNTWIHLVPNNKGDLQGGIDFGR